MKTLISLLLGSAILLVACHNDGNQSMKHGRTRRPVPPFNYVYYDFGELPELNFDKAQAVILKKYNLSYYSFGCVVTDSLTRAVRRHNDSLFALLQPNFPGFSEDRLRQEIQVYMVNRAHGDKARHPVTSKIERCIVGGQRHG